MAQVRIHRITLFKLPDPEHQKKLLEAYQVLAKEQQKDGKPYILSLCAGPTMPDERSKGYTVVGKTEFASLEDMKYYDDGCAAHAKLRSTLKALGIPEPPTSMYFEAAPLINL